MYGHFKISDVNKMRSDTVRKRFTPGDVDLCHVAKVYLLRHNYPLSNISSETHKGANFQTMSWKQAIGAY